MSLRKETPCDYGVCPYEAEYHNTCEYYCGAEEPQDDPEIWEDWEAEQNQYEYEEICDRADVTIYI